MSRNPDGDKGNGRPTCTSSVASICVVVLVSEAPPKLIVKLPVASSYSPSV